jgi:purine-binding chemotaxis protein CheW
MAMESMKAIICRISAEEYALNVNHVLSIERIQNIRPVPHTEAHMAGIMQLRGSIVPVMDLRSWLGLEPTGQDHEGQAEKRIVVTEYNDKRLGLIVDAATDVTDIDLSSVQSVEMNEGSKEISRVANLDSRLILILDVPTLIDKLHFVFDQVETA